MEKILCFLNGYVEVLICGGQTERFFNLCMARGIVVRNLRQNKDKSFTCIFSVSHFFLLGPIRRKTKVRIHILEKQGLPFWVEKGVKRKAFFLGIFLCGMLLLMLSGRIWNIHIEGNRANSTPEILKFLEDQGVSHGMKKKIFKLQRHCSFHPGRISSDSLGFCKNRRNTTGYYSKRRGFSE